MKTYHTRRNTEPYQTMEYKNELRKNPHIEVLHSDPPQLRVNGKIIPWPQGKTPEEAYQDYLERESKPVPLNQLSEEEPSPAEEQHFVRQQGHSLHPLRQQYLQDRLKQLDYLDCQQALQDDFTTRMYGKKDYSKEQKKIRQELQLGSTPQKRQAEKKFSWQDLQDGRRSQLPGTQSPAKRFWDIADEQTGQENYPNTPTAVSQEISRYKRENPDEYASYLKKWQDDQKSWQEIDQDIQDGTLSKQDISPAQWDTILSKSQKELDDKQDPQKNPDQKPYCNIYARNRLLQKGIYMAPDKNANQMIEDIDKKGSGWEKLPKKVDAQGNPTGKLDHQEAQRRAEAGGTVVATYHNPNNAEHGHIALVNAEAGMKRSGKWGGEVPSVDGYNPDTQQITEGGSLSEQFSTPREPHMDYYEYTGPEKEKEKE